MPFLSNAPQNVRLFDFNFSIEVFHRSAHKFLINIFADGLLPKFFQRHIFHTLSKVTYFFRQLTSRVTFVQRGCTCASYETINEGTEEGVRLCTVFSPLLLEENDSGGRGCCIDLRDGHINNYPRRRVCTTSRCVAGGEDVRDSSCFYYYYYNYIKICQSGSGVVAV